MPGPGFLKPEKIEIDQTRGGFSPGLLKILIADKKMLKKVRVFNKLNNYNTKNGVLINSKFYTYSFYKSYRIDTLRYTGIMNKLNFPVV
jgi:hypothetical protein